MVHRSTSRAAKITSKVNYKRSREDSEHQESSSQASGDFEERSSHDSRPSSDKEEPENEDADAPRIVQWDDDDDLVYEQDDDDEEEEEEPSIKPNGSKLLALENDLKGMPLGALRTAQAALHEAESDNDSDTNASEGSDSERLEQTRRERKEKVYWTSNVTRKKRPNKNAQVRPMEVTSKKPVTRKRIAVDVPKVPRDPRFLPLAGEFKPEAFQKSYGFLAESHKTELSTLREYLMRARKSLASSPRGQLEERQAEVERLEWAVKRAESLVNKDRHDAIQHDALARAKGEEKEKRKEGKGEWWMKKGEKREILNKARFEAIAAEGGGRAVRKAIDKKQKKISQKEKRSRPYAKGKAFETVMVPRSRPANSISREERPRKRQRPS